MCSASISRRDLLCAAIGFVLGMIGLEAVYASRYIRRVRTRRRWERALSEEWAPTI